MSSFAAATIKKPDPLKRVNYPFGLVLGVDEFVQEQTYLLEQVRGHQRLLHGHGTVWGLRVEVPADVDPPEVRISAGMAVAPAGMRICVPSAMCAQLDRWIAARLPALRAIFGEPPFDLPLCVVLCYRECQTDIVPLPGEPCRSEEETQAPARIADTFELKLCLHEEAPGSPPGSPPASPPTDLGIEICRCPTPSAQEQGTEGFARLLRRIVVDPGAATFATRQEIEDEVRALAGLVSSGSPPGPGGPLEVRPQDLQEFLQAAARVWVTETLPELLRQDRTDTCGSAGDACVFLATLRVPVGAAGAVLGGPGAVGVNDSARPVLLASGLLQAWLLAGGPVDRA